MLVVFRWCVLLVVISLLSLISILTPYNIPTEAFAVRDSQGQLRPHQVVAAQHPLYHVIPRHRSQIACHDILRWMLWTLFGNDDDGIFGEESARFQPDVEPSLAKAIAWNLRNPLHNFCFYIIGSAESVNSAFTLLEVSAKGVKAYTYEPEATTVFAGEQSSLYLALHGGKPFVSICWNWNDSMQSKFYLGWRCRGNFGAKLILWGHQKTVR